MSLDRPTIAVVIPNYNYSRYLKQTVESVLNQSPSFDEIIVVDDGSTDNSLEVLRQFSGRVKVVAIANGGQLGAIMAGVKATESDYIHTLDADDYALAGLVAEIAGVLANRPAKVQFQLESVKDDGNSLRSFFPTYPSDYDAAAMRSDNAKLGVYVCPPTSGNVFSRKVLNSLGLETFDPSGTIDGSPLFAMPYFGEIVSMNVPLVCYRVHEGSMSGGNAPTSRLLNYELSNFYKCWKELNLLLREVGEAFDESSSLFVKEREMLIASLAGRASINREVKSFNTILWQTNFTFKKKTILNIWAYALMIPSVRYRTYIIGLKRSAANRPKIFQSAIAYIARFHS